MKNLYSIILFLLYCLGTHAQNNPIDEIDSLLNGMTDKDEFSGSVLIANSSKVLLSKGYGYADRENQLKNTPNTRFDLSSASKVFTGTAICYLAQKGKLKFDDPVDKYIKGLPQGHKITIHQLLTHSSGLDDFFKAKNFSYKNIGNCTDMLPFIRSMPLAYNPGDSCIYSTGNPIVLGAVIEKITGMSFQDYIESTFIKPLNLKNTSFAPYWSLEDEQREYAIGYSRDSTGTKRKPFDYDHGSIPLSAGGMWSSTSDLYHFDQAVFSGKILNDKYLKIMTTEYTTQWENAHFGYLWIISDKKGYKSIGHPGSSSGWLTMNDYYPIQGYTVIIMTNIGSVDVYSLSDKIENILFDKKAGN